MLLTPLILALAVGAGAEPRRPRSIAVTDDGSAELSSLSRATRTRVAEAFSVAPRAAPPESPGEGDFWIRLAATSSGAVSIEVQEAGAMIARREAQRTADLELDVGLVLRATLARALRSGPPRTIGASRVVTPVRDVEPLDPAPGSRPRGLARSRARDGALERATLRASGAVEVATVGVGGAGAVGAETTWAIGRLSALFGLEVGYARAVRQRAISVDRVPVSALAGLWLSDTLPLAAGLVGSVDWERAATTEAIQRHVRARFGLFGRGRVTLSDALAVVIEGRVEAPTRRLRYLLEGNVTLTELPFSVALGTGMEWRWR